MVSSPHGEGDLVTALEAKAKEKEEAMVAKVRPPVLGQDSHSIPYFLRLRQALPWWELHGSPQAVELIRWGVPAPAWIPNHLSHGGQAKSPEEVQLALQVLGEYLEVKAVRVVPPSTAHHLVPWFIVTKKEFNSEKHRLIADCREVNSFLETKHFKLDHWESIFPFLKKGLWGAKVDLKNAYFHLELAKELKPYICMNVGGKVFQFDSACFGLSTLPQQWMVIMKVFAKLWRKRGILCFIYLDDILVLNSNPPALRKDLEFILHTLRESGMVVNEKKSILEPVQNLEHLGFLLDLGNGLLKVPSHKLKTVRKELGKVVTSQSMTIRKMASVLGSVRAFLVALPFLRSFTDQMLQFVSKAPTLGWDYEITLPPLLKDELKVVKNLLDNWEGRPFLEKEFCKVLHSDASQEAWAGVNVSTGEKVVEYWREKRTLHINVKELEAAIHTVRSLAKKGERVHLCVDNSVTYAYLRKGGVGCPTSTQS